MHFKPYLLAPFLLFLSPVYAQQAEEKLVQEIIENVAESLAEDFDFSELMETLYKFRKHPLNLNKATPADLKSFIFLSPLQINNFFLHTKEHGLLIDLLELQSINGFDAQSIQNLLPFVSLNSPTEYENFSLKQLWGTGTHDIILRVARILEKQKGFRDLPGSRYLGTPEKIQMRYRYQYGKAISAAVTLDKDAGEKLIGKPFDFVSASIAVNDLKFFKRIVIGDYALQYGQGLNLWTGFAPGKSTDITSIVKKDVGLKPYTSSNEYSFLRGFATTMQVSKNVEITSFVSYRKLDASQELNEADELVQKTINQSGLHRTPSEIKNHNSLKQFHYGLITQLNNQTYNIGLILHQTRFSHAFITQKQPYDFYSFTGSSFNNAGIHYNYTFKNIYLFGEFASGLHNGTAHLNGALISLSPELSSTISYRNYGKNYHNFFSNALSDSSSPQNEKGLFSSLSFIPDKRWAFNFYTDFYSFPWLKYRVDAPSSGYDVVGQGVYTPTKLLKILIRFKTVNKQQNTDLVVPINFLDNTKREYYRLDISWKPVKKFSFQNRAEFSQYKKGTGNSEIGYLIYQDVDYAPSFSKLRSNIRLAYFNTPSYNSRIYAYEDDVLYGAGFGIYNGQGMRTYLNLRYSLNKKIHIWTKYSLSIYKDAKTVGTYLDEINGNKKSELKLQCRFQF